MKKIERKIHEYRKDYNKSSISIENSHKNPFIQFHEWFLLAEQAGSFEPNAMALSTCTEKLQPSSRIVLLKEYSNEKGFIFFTNYESRKGKELANNPKASLLFFWGTMEKQIRIEGTIEKISPEASDEYFYTRPLENQAGAIVSNQSSEIMNIDVLKAEMTKLTEQGKLKRPENWGGYALVPNYFEFWQGSIGRLHDRITYQLINNEWTKKRIAP